MAVSWADSSLVKVAGKFNGLRKPPAIHPETLSLLSNEFFHQVRKY